MEKDKLIRNSFLFGFNRADVIKLMTEQDKEIKKLQSIIDKNGDLEEQVKDLEKKNEELKQTIYHRDSMIAVFDDMQKVKYESEISSLKSELETKENAINSLQNKSDGNVEKAKKLFDDTIESLNKLIN